MSALDWIRALIVAAIDEVLADITHPTTETPERNTAE